MKRIATFPSQILNRTMLIPMNSPTIGVISSHSNIKQYLVALIPNNHYDITIKSDFSLYSNNLCDTILNYIYQKNKACFEQARINFTKASQRDSLSQICKHVNKIGNSEIIKQGKNLTKTELHLLLMANNVMTDNFLFHFGRNTLELDRNDAYYNSIMETENDSAYITIFPKHTLYQFEVEYYRLNKSIESIESFIGFIRYKVFDVELSDYLVAIYIDQLMRNSSDWKLHRPLINPDLIRNLVREEKNNRHINTIKESCCHYVNSHHMSIEGIKPSYLPQIYSFLN